MLIFRAWATCGDTNLITGERVESLSEIGDLINFDY